MNRATEHSEVNLEQLQLGWSIHVLCHTQCNPFHKRGPECPP